MSEVPYPGLRPFRRDEVDVFFGREKSIDKLLAMLGRHRFLAVVGESGCGKSSLVRAGMIPALETGLLAAAGARWRVARMRPGEAPLRGLAAALLDAAALGPERAGQPGAEAFLYATLRRGPLGLVEVLADTPLPPRTNLLLLVDQFEEIFRYRRHGDRDEADAFVALLLASVARPEAPVFVTLTMRSDFLGDCAQFAGLPEAMNDSQFLTPRMSRRQREVAIVGPAGVFGAAVEPALVNRLLNDMGADPDQLPLMQHVLMRMWNRSHAEAAGSAPSEVRPPRLTVADYEAVGGFADALSHHADEAFGELDPVQQRIAEALFRALSERSLGSRGGRDTRRPARLEEVAAVAGVAPAEVVPVIEAFRHPDRSFLTPPVPRPLAAETVLDIGHESLIRQWRRLAEWVEGEALSAAIFRRLVETARLWRDGQAGLWGTPDLDLALAWRARREPTAAWAERYGGDFALAMEFLAASEANRHAEHEEAERARAERDKQRRTRQTSALLAVGLLLALGIAAIAGWQFLRAEASEKVARSGLLVAVGAAEARDHPQRSLLLGAEAVAIAPDPALPSAQAARELLLGLLTNVGGRALTGHTDEVQAAAFTAGGRWLATTGDDGTVRLWSVGDPAAPAVVLDAGGDEQRVLAVSPDGRRLAAGGAAGVVRVWDLAAVATAVAAGGGAAAAPPAPLELPDHGDSITALAWSPDGRLLASGSQDRAVRLWAASAPEVPPVVLTAGRDEITGVAWSPDGRWLAAGSEDNDTRLWRLRDGGAPDPPTVLTGHRGTVHALVFSPDGHWLATGSEDNTIRLWPVGAAPTAGGGAGVVLAGHHSSVNVLAVSPDGQWLASGSHDHDMRLWDLAAAARGVTTASAVLTGHEAPISGLAVSPDSRWLVSASWDRKARIWNLTAAEPGASSIPLIGHDEYLLAVAISPDGRTVATASGDCSARLWPLVSEPLAPRTPVTVLGGHQDTVTAVAASPDGRWLATASADNTARLWDLHEANFSTDSRKLAKHESSLHAAAISPDGRWLATGGNDDTVRLWDLTAADPAAAPEVLHGDGSSVSSLVFTPDGRWLATGSRDDSVRLWPLTGADPAAGMRQLAGHRDSVTALAVSPDSRWLASASQDRTVHLWDLGAAAPEDEAMVLEGHQREIHSVAFSPDGRWVASGSEDHTARVWEVAAPAKPPLVLAGHADAVVAVVFTADGRRLASGSDDDTVRLWDLAAADPAAAPEVLHGHGEGVTTLAVVPHRGWLVSASWDGGQLWDLDTSPAAQVGVLAGHRGAIVSLAVSAAGDLIFTGSDDRTARVWTLDLFTLPLADLAVRARTVAGRDLIAGERARFHLPAKGD